MKNVFRLFSYPFSLTAIEGTFNDLEYSSWSIPVSFMLVLVTEPSSEFVIFHPIVPARCLWMDSDALICSAIPST